MFLCCVFFSFFLRKLTKCQKTPTAERFSGAGGHAGIFLGHRLNSDNSAAAGFSSSDTNRKTLLGTGDRLLHSQIWHHVTSWSNNSMQPYQYVNLTESGMPTRLVETMGTQRQLLPACRVPAANESSSHLTQKWIRTLKRPARWHLPPTVWGVGKRVTLVINQQFRLRGVHRITPQTAWFRNPLLSSVDQIKQQEKVNEEGAFDAPSVVKSFPSVVKYSRGRRITPLTSWRSFYFSSWINQLSPLCAVTAARRNVCFVRDHVP